MEVIKAFDDQRPITKRLTWSGVNHDSYYYVAQTGRLGRKPGEMTLKTDGNLVSNHEVLEGTRDFPGIGFLCYGFVPVTEGLFHRRFILNHKNVYSLMK